MNYPVGDFLIRIKNAVMAKNRDVVVTKTKLIKEVAKALKKEGFVGGISEEKNQLIVRLAYKKKEPVIMNLKLISKPGLRVYKGVDDLEKIKGPSTLILSTPLGVISKKEALKKRVGGEVLVEIW